MEHIFSSYEPLKHRDIFQPPRIGIYFLSRLKRYAIFREVLSAFYRVIHIDIEQSNDLINSPSKNDKLTLRELR